MNSTPSEVKRGRGRPTLLPEDAMSCRITIRLTPAEHRDVNAAAVRNKTTVSNHFRSFIVDIARAELNGELD